MKNVILIAVYMLIAALTFGIVMTLYGRIVRKMELESSLSSVAEEALENVMLAKNYEVEDYDLFLADFIENLSEILDTDSEITAEVLKADLEKGILAVEVKETYTHLNGKRGTVKCRRTVIFNKLLEETVSSHEVKFYLTEADMQKEQNCYKVYIIREGDRIIMPADPTRQKAQFDGWKDVNGYLADFTQPVTEEMIFYAVWN